MDYRKQITVNDIKFYNAEIHTSDNGNLVAIESSNDIPFDIERIFYVFGVGDQSTRGCHAHYKTRQILICLNGKIEVLCKDGDEERAFLLESPRQALYIPEMIWDEQVYRSPDSILLSMCNTEYNPTDYIHDYEEFKKMKQITRYV